jgi:dTDP-glucose pyrophosphorylase
MPRDFRSCLVAETATLLDAMRALDAGAIEIAFVVDEAERFVGTLTDGDVRRALLAGAGLEAPLAPYVNRRAIRLGAGSGRVEALELMQVRSIGQIPVVDAEGRIVRVHLLRDMLASGQRDHWAVVMAGGLGTRLGSLTRNTPKPMLRVAGRPILERIVLHLAGHGIRRIFLSVNYLAHVIEDHFGDGSLFGVDIDYLRENAPLGTGGSLSLLPEPPTLPLLVMNGDLVTQANIGDMLGFHDTHGATVTVGTRRYHHTVPFGCIDTDGDRIVRMEEKPTLTRQVNAGLYVVSPEVVARVPPSTAMGVPDLVDDCLRRGEPVCGYEIVDDWIDVGQRDQLQAARGETA